MVLVGVVEVPSKEGSRKDESNRSSEVRVVAAEAVEAEAIVVW